jgi:hypothetical protein
MRAVSLSVVAKYCPAAIVGESMDSKDCDDIEILKGCLLKLNCDTCTGCILTFERKRGKVNPSFNRLLRTSWKCPL